MGLLSWLSNKEELEEQKEQNKITNYANAADTATTSMNQLEESLNAIKENELAIDTQQSTIDTYNEWLENYQKMLNGDRSETELGMQLYSLESSATLAKQSAADYLLSSALQKESTYNTAFNDYTTMLKNQSLLNVAASSGGGKSSAYSMQSLLYTQQLKNFVGVDLKFNATNETGSTAQPEGSFLREFTSLTQQIKTQTDNLNYAAIAAQNAVKTFYLQSETQANEYTEGIKDAQNSIERFKEAIEQEKANAKTWQTNLLQSMEMMLDNGANGNIAALNEYYELYKEAGYEGTLEDFFNEIDKNYGWSAAADGNDNTSFNIWGATLTGYDEKDRDERRAVIQQYMQYKNQYDKLSKKIEEAGK